MRRINNKKSEEAKAENILKEILQKPEVKAKLEKINEDLFLHGEAVIKI